eukprot:m.49112 g.49112  ORF g.49112 m.49112 type:complete len:287 (+) comp15301_c0_seq4:228-1088(+)
MRKSVVTKSSKGVERKQTSKQTNQQQQRQKKIKKKPKWDDSVSDLGQHKLSTEELEKKREAVLSANADRAKRLLHERLQILNAVTQQDRTRGNTSRRVNDSPGDKHMSKLMREVLYGENQEVLQNVLRGESQSVDVLEELFGGKAMKFTSEPEITSAPGEDSDEDDSTSNIMWAPPAADSPPRRRRAHRADSQTREQHGFTTTDGMIPTHHSSVAQSNALGTCVCAPCEARILNYHSNVHRSVAKLMRTCTRLHLSRTHINLCALLCTVYPDVLPADVPSLMFRPY